MGTLLKIGEPSRPDPTLSRRAFMLTGVSAAAALSACQPQATPETGDLAAWPDVDVPVVDHPGYGWEPDYFELVDGGPWPRILTDLQKRKLEKISDTILPASDTAPAPSQIGIAEFWDEWISAPYPWQTDTRNYVWNGLVWLDAQYDKMFGTDFMSASQVQDKAVFDLWSSVSRHDGPETRIGWFFRHMRHLTVGAYYTTPEGMADIGHKKNVPIAGDYPGPSAKALAHLDQLLADVGLSR